MLDFSNLKHPWWTGLVFPLVLAIGSTFSPSSVRVVLLIGAVLAATGTVYLTKYGGRKLTKTAPVAILSSVLALVVFAGGRIFESKPEPSPVQASGDMQQQEKSKEPGVQQHSEGPNGPNIVGNGNIVNYGNHVSINVNSPASLPQPTFQEESEDVSFSLGEHGFTDTQRISDLKKGPHMPFDLGGGYSPVTVSFKGGVLLYDIKFWGGTGKPPIEVKNNKFTVRVPEWDRNFNASAFEVVDSNNVPILQVIRKTPTHIIVNGIFPLPDGLLLPAGPNGAIPTGVRSVPRDFILQPIFNYPAWKYPGQLVNSSPGAVTAPITSGPCSVVQVGGSNNQAVGGNCGPPPLVLDVVSVKSGSEGTDFIERPGFVKTEITIVPNQQVTAPFTIALDFNNPIADIGNTVKNVGAQMGGGPFTRGIHARETVSTSIGPSHPLVVVVFSLLPVNLVGLPRIEY